jgi:hypothetical protein
MGGKYHERGEYLPFQGEMGGGYPYQKQFLETLKNIELLRIKI